MVKHRSAMDPSVGAHMDGGSMRDLSFWFSDGRNQGDVWFWLAGEWNLSWWRRLLDGVCSR
jgi:hypothetical protein